MKIISKIKIHSFFYIVLIINFFTGYFKEYMFFICIIAFHELGHILGALYYKWQIEKITILPFGGLTLFNEKINKPLKEQLVITILGPLFQIIISFFITNQTMYNYHLILLVFNLLPILPLDGSKLVNILLNIIFCYRFSEIMTIIISLITLFSLLFFKLSLVTFLIILFLLFNVIKEIINYKYKINKFLLERYTNNFIFKKRITIRNYKNMYLWKYNIILINDHYYTEKQLLKDKYVL